MFKISIKTENNFYLGLIELSGVIVSVSSDELEIGCTSHWHRDVEGALSECLIMIADMDRDAAKMLDDQIVNQFPYGSLMLPF